MRTDRFAVGGQRSGATLNRQRHHLTSVVAHVVFAPHAVLHLPSAAVARREVDLYVNEYHDAARDVEGAQRRIQYVADIAAQLLQQKEQGNKNKQDESIRFHFISRRWQPAAVTRAPVITNLRLVKLEYVDYHLLRDESLNGVDCIQVKTW